MTGKNKTPPILQLTIFKDSGLVLYHQSFTKNEKVDPFLFAGFTAGILAFSRQLGSEISTMTLQNSTYHIKRVDSIIFVVATPPSTPSSVINRLIDRLFDNEEFIILMNQAMNETVITSQLAENLQRTILKIIDQEFSSDANIKHGSAISQAELQHEIQNILKELRFGRSNPRRVAERLFGQEILKYQEESGYTDSIINMLESILNSDELDLEPNVKKGIQELIQYLKDKWFKAATVATTALF